MRHPLIFLITAVLAPSLHADVSVTNLTSGETIRYPAPLLRGNCPDKAATSVKITNLTAKDRPPITRVASDGHFIGLAHLTEGENKIELECGTEKSTLTLNYKPQTNRHLVRSIYAVDSSGDTNYQSPLADDPQNYREKFGTAMLLLQSLTAEWMHDQGFGRLTFNLELDEDQKVIVHTFKDTNPKDKYFGMDDLKWWREMYGLMENGGFPTREAKNVVVAGYTYFDPEKKQVFAHTALGGGGLGLFGSGGMFTWPNSLGDSFRAFSDTTPVNPNLVHNDSAGRDNQWGMAATTIGAVCHELGHTFGLPHTNDNRGIMSRGFDHLNRMFGFADAPSAHRQRVLGPWTNGLPYWSPESASFLRYSRYFALDDIDYSQDGDPGLEVVQSEEDSSKLTVRARHGVRVVAIAGGGDSVTAHDTYSEAAEPRILVEYSVPDLEKRAGQGEFSIRVMDGRGNYRKFSSNEILKR